MIELSGILPATASGLARRAFFKGIGKAGLGAAALSFVGESALFGALSPGAGMDTANQIFQAAVIAEDLATTFYYNGLIGPVIQDPTWRVPAERQSIRAHPEIYRTWTISVPLFLRRLNTQICCAR